MNKLELCEEPRPTPPLVISVPAINKRVVLSIDSVDGAVEGEIFEVLEKFADLGKDSVVDIADVGGVEAHEIVLVFPDGIIEESRVSRENNGTESTGFLRNTTHLVGWEL